MISKVDNAVLDAIRERRSVRTFTSQPVTDEQVQAVLEAGRWAPSALNSQPWDFIVVKDSETRSKMAHILRRVTVAWGGFSGAPVTIVVSVDAKRDPAHHVEDGAAAAQNMCLAAHSMGLGSSWAGIYSGRVRRGSAEYALKKLLALPASHRIVAVVPLGVANGNGNGHESARIPLQEMVHNDRFTPRQRYLS